MKNILNREIPQEYLEKYKLFEGSSKNYNEIVKTTPRIKTVGPNDNKMLKDIREAIEKTGLKDGMTISFHHHFREGDYIVNMVMDEIHKMGIKNIKIAPSSLNSVHSHLIEYIKDKTITGITTSGLRGKLAEEISHGILEEPVIIRSHGGRARAIIEGDIKIDVAFIGASSSDEYGNASGINGRNNCGALGYPIVDSEYADKVVVITDTIVPYPNMPNPIKQTNVDYVVVIDEIGNPEGISTGATRYTKNPKDLLIAKNAAKAIENSGYFKEGMSIQTGSGGAALAVARYLKDMMKEKEVKASFALGGITSPIVDMLNDGLVENIFDVQGFDMSSAEDIQNNPKHHEISSDFYANAHNKGAAVNKLDIVILSALEIDTDFNVNVMTGSDGILRGASGGHCDTATGAKLTVIVSPLIRGRIPCVVNKVNTVITPGEDIDVLVTDQGMAVNPKREDLIENFKKANIKLTTIEELKEKAFKTAGVPQDIKYEDRVIALIEYRDGTLIDVVRKI